MKDAAAALAAFLERLGRFFDIFDLSFVVSGATAVGAIMFIFDTLGFAALPLTGWVKVATLAIACYVAGLLCFAAGRWVRLRLQRSQALGGFDATFEVILSAHGLDNVPEVASYLRRIQQRGAWRLYVRLWAEVRQASEMSESVALLNRYWVMAATYDGMVIAMLTWVAAVAAWVVSAASTRMDYIAAIGTVAALLMLVRACSREAGRYEHYQIEELVGSVAALRARGDGMSIVSPSRKGEHGSPP